MLKRFFIGFGFVFTGLRLIREVKSIKLWLVFPLLIDIVLLWAGVYYGSEQIHLLVQKATLLVLGSQSTSYFNYFYYPALALFWILFIVIYFYFIFLIASVVASPFYSIISEKVLMHLKIIEERPFSFVHTLKHSAKMFWVSILRSLILLALGLLLFIGAFIPGLNLLIGFISFVLLAFDAADYSFEARHFNLQQRLHYFRQHLIEFCGMGAFIGLTAVVPGLILLVMPIAVIGVAGVMQQTESTSVSQK